jgi:hypothetical protein
MIAYLVVALFTALALATVLCVVLGLYGADNESLKKRIRELGNADAEAARLRGQLAAERKLTADLRASHAEVTKRNLLYTAAVDRISGELGRLHQAARAQLMASEKGEKTRAA